MFVNEYLKNLYTGLELISIGLANKDKINLDLYNRLIEAKKAQLQRIENAEKAMSEDNDSEIAHATKIYMIDNDILEYEGHRYHGRERFSEDARHMIIFDIIRKDIEPYSNFKTDRIRLFLRETEYLKALDDERYSIIKIVTHARVDPRLSTIHYDSPDTPR